MMNGSSCPGLLHCHYFLYAYPCLCCSHLHTDMEKQLALTNQHHIGRISFAMNGLVPPVQP